MGFDDEKQRRSAIPGGLPIPDGEIDLGDRRDLLGLYVFGDQASGTSQVYEELTVTLIKFTLNKKDGSGTDTFYISKDYYDSGGIYANSPEAFPVLAVDPRLQQSLGRVFGNRHDVSIEVYAHTDFDRFGRSFSDLRDEYEFQGAPVEVWKYWKATGANASNTESRNKRLTLQIAGVTLNNDFLTILCKDTWFEDRVIGPKGGPEVTSEGFTDIQDAWDGESGPIVIGDGAGGGQIVTPPRISDSSSNNSLFISWESANNSLNSDALQKIYMQNTTQEFGGGAWLELDTNLTDGRLTTEHQEFTTALNLFGSPNEYHLNYYWRAIRLAPTSNHALTSVRAQLWRDANGGAPGDGDLKLFVHLMEDAPESDSILLKDQIVEKTFDLQEVVSAFASPTPTNPDDYIVRFDFNPFIPLIAGLKYAIVLGHSRPPTQDPITGGISGGPAIAYASELGATHYSKWHEADRDTGWVKAENNRLGVGVYGMTIKNALSTQTVQGHPYARLIVGDGNATSSEATQGTEFKVAVNGISDVAGKYTGGVTGTTIENAADVVRFFLQDETLGGGLENGDLVVNEFSEARGVLAAEEINLSFSLDVQTRLSSLLFAICEQAGLILFKNRVGQLRLVAPVWSGTSDFEAELNQGLLGEDMQVVNIVETATEAVYNDLQYNFGINHLEVPQDRAFTRRVGGDTFNSVAYANSEAASAGLEDLTAMLEESKDIYGNLELKLDFSLHPSGSNGPANVLRKLAQRFSRKQKLVTVRLPLRKFRNLNLMHTARLRHEDLPADNVKGMELRAFNSNGSNVEFLSDNSPATLISTGLIQGFIKGIVEVGEDVQITVETESPF